MASSHIKILMFHLKKKKNFYKKDFQTNIKVAGLTLWTIVLLLIILNYQHLYL